MGVERLTLSIFHNIWLRCFLVIIFSIFRFSYYYRNQLKAKELTNTTWDIWWSQGTLLHKIQWSLMLLEYVLYLTLSTSKISSRCFLNIQICHLESDLKIVFGNADIKWHLHAAMQYFGSMNKYFWSFDHADCNTVGMLINVFWNITAQA